MYQFTYSFAKIWKVNSIHANWKVNKIWPVDNWNHEIKYCRAFHDNNYAAMTKKCQKSSYEMEMRIRMECIRSLLSLNELDIVRCTQLNRIFKLSPSSSCTSFFRNDTCRTLKERTKKMFSTCVLECVFVVPIYFRLL